MTSPKSLAKHLAYRAMRPGLIDLTREGEAQGERVDRLLEQSGRIEAQLAHHAELLARLAQPDVVPVWKGDLSSGGAFLPNGMPDREATRKYRDELSYWVDAVRRPEQVGFDKSFHEIFCRWQRERLTELSQFAGLADDGPALDAWCRARAVIEIGGGPFPCVASATWRSAIAVDPIADGYVVEGLVPETDEGRAVVHIASAGENVPVASGSADLVILENALDHVANPLRVLAEVRRLLRPDGLLWLLVDLMEYRDHMHPNPFNEDSIRRLLVLAGFETQRDRVSDHKSHPQAYGEYRALLRRRADEPHPPVVVVAAGSGG